MKKLEELLRRICGKIAPDKHITVIVVTFLIFAALSLWVTVSAIYRIGKSGETNQIKHIYNYEHTK